MDLSTNLANPTGEDPSGAGSGDADKSSTPSDGGTPDCQAPKTTDEPTPPKAPEEGASTSVASYICQFVFVLETII